LNNNPHSGGDFFCLNYD